MKQKTRIILLLMALIAAMCCGAAGAEIITGNCGEDVFWSLDDTTGILTITGNGPMTDYSYYDESAPFYHNNSIRTVIIGNGVTTIGASLFLECHNITSVTIPTGVTSIGDYAFQGCARLTSVAIPDSVICIGSSAFLDCTGLNNIAIPNGVTRIEGGTFFGCSSLTGVTIPNGVISIDGYAFCDCTNLISVTIPSSVINIGEGAFDGCTEGDFTIYGYTNSAAEIYATETGITFHSIGTAPDPSGKCGERVTWTIKPATGILTISGSGTMTDFDDYGSPFYNIDIIRTAVIENGVTTIGANLFKECSNLASVTIPNSVTSIGKYAFDSCNGLASVTIPSSVTSIGYGAFARCSSLTRMTIPSSVTSIENYTFSGCGSLMSITIPNSVTSIGVGAFLSCDSLLNVTIPKNVKRIAEWSFYGCTSLTSVMIPNGVTSIGEDAFFDCTNLTSVTIPNSLTSVASGAFSNCTNLTSVTIPDGLTSIGSFAFSDCTSLTGVTIPSSVISIGENAFYGCTMEGFTIYGYTNSAAEIYAIEAGIPFYSLGEVSDPSGQCGNSVTWTLSLATGTLTITGNGIMMDYDDYNSPFYYNDGIHTVFIESGITTIGANLFAHCHNLTSITIPNEVIRIGEGAFSGCYSLTSVTIPNKVTRIGERAFSDCYGLTSVTIPKSVTNISQYAFDGCYNLQNVYYEGELSDWDAISISPVGNDPLFEAIPFCKPVVTFDTQGGIPAIEPITLNRGELVPEPERPSKVGALFTGWFMDPNCTAGYNFTTSVTADLTLYAGWTVPAPDSFLKLPAALTAIEDEAFLGVQAQAVIVPKSVTVIADNAFQNSMLLYVYGYPGSAAEAYAAEHSTWVKFVPIDDNWLANY